MAQGSPLPTCSQCLDSKPHEIPPWIEEGGLGNDTIKLYQALQVDGRDVRITNDLTAEQVADLVAAYKSILESHASKLWSLAKNDEEEKLVFRQADLVDEMHRVCAECVNALAELAETLKESQPVRVACYWGHIGLFHHLMWKSLRLLDNRPGLSTEAHGSHMGAADHFHREAHSFTVKNLPSHSALILETSYYLARFTWDTTQDPVKPYKILHKGIWLAEENCKRFEHTIPRVLLRIKDLQVAYGRFRALIGDEDLAREAASQEL